MGESLELNNELREMFERMYKKFTGGDSVTGDTLATQLYSLVQFNFLNSKNDSN